MKQALRLGLVGALALNLSACFRPLYGPTASGESMPALLAAVQVDDVAWRRARSASGTTCAAS